MMWSIWLLDRLFASGIDDLVTCATERMHVRLPCHDHTFERGLPSKAEFLN
jgi:hypothetical protein